MDQCRHQFCMYIGLCNEGNPGQPLREERFEIDNSGRRIAEGSTSGSNRGRIEDVSDVSEEQQKENDRLYEERMEEEYAKREGGA